MLEVLSSLLIYVNFTYLLHYLLFNCLISLIHSLYYVVRTQLSGRPCSSNACIPLYLSISGYKIEYKWDSISIFRLKDNTDYF